MTWFRVVGQIVRNEYQFEGLPRFSIVTQVLVLCSRASAPRHAFARDEAKDRASFPSRARASLPVAG